MVTVLKTNGLRVVIFSDDHDPAHVHVFGDGQAKINLRDTASGPELIWAEGMTRTEARRAMRLVLEHQTLLLARWRDMHG